MDGDGDGFKLEERKWCLNVESVRNRTKCVFGSKSEKKDDLVRMHWRHLSGEGSRKPLVSKPEIRCLRDVNLTAASVVI